MPSPNWQAVFLLLLAASSLCPANAGASNDEAACSFKERNPRYYTLSATVQVTGARADTLLSDALLRAVSASFGLAECQPVLTEGQKCGASLAEVPCQDPFFLCNGTVAVSQSLYEAAASGVCQRNKALGDTGVCESLAKYPNVVAMAAADLCQEVCVASLTSSASGGASLAPPAPPSGAPASSCFTYTLQVDTATEQEAIGVAEGLQAESLLANLTTTADAFKEEDAKVDVLVANTAVKKVVGFGFFPPPPPPPPPPLLQLAPNSPPTASAPPPPAAANATLVFGEWGACTAACGDGWQLRSASCVGTGGAILPLSACPGAANATTSRSCKMPACSSSYWQYSAWSTCNATCGGGYAFRSATCVTKSGSKCGSQPYPTVTQCNTEPCEVYTWHVEDWGECSAPCGGGVRTRVVQCLDASGQLADSGLCPKMQPAATERCNLAVCDFCADNTCAGHGSCADNKCNCEDEYTGAYCEIPPGCDSGLVDLNLACCNSGILSSSGTCCPKGAVLDAQGECCTGELDACGVCNGTGVAVDIQGTCCSSLLDAEGLCCMSGNLDECGICNGLSNSCAISMQLGLLVNSSLMFGSGVQESAIDDFFSNVTDILQLPPSSLEVDSLQLAGPRTSTGQRKLLATSKPTPANASAATNIPLTATITLLPNGTGPSSNVPFTTAWIKAAFAATQERGNIITSGPVTLVSIPTMERKGICGNGICELGERTIVGQVNGTCLWDCPVVAEVCKPGCVHGTCLATSGTCQCFAGYTGGDCNECAPGYLPSNGVCTADVVQLRLVNSSLIAPLPPAPPPVDPPLVTEEGGSAESQGGNDGSQEASLSPSPDASNVGIASISSPPQQQPTSEGSNNNLGAILGPIFGVLGAAAFGFGLYAYMKRRRRNLATPPASYGGESPSRGTTHDVESQSMYGLVEDDQALRHKFSRSNSVASGGSSRALRDFSNAQASIGPRIISSQEFKKYMTGFATLSDGIPSRPISQATSGQSSGPLAMGMVDPSQLRQSLDPMRQSYGSLRQSVGSIQMGSVDLDAVRQSVSASTTALPPRPPRHPDSLRASLNSNSGAPLVAAMADLRASTELRASSAGLHIPTGASVPEPARDQPPQAPASSLALDATPSIMTATVPGSVGPTTSLEQYGKTMMSSYTISPLDPKARLFFNPLHGDPTYNEDQLRASINKAYKVLPLSARSTPAVKEAIARPPLTARERMEEPLRESTNTLDTNSRREKLSHLRAAVEALDAAVSPEGKGPLPFKELQSPGATTIQQQPVSRSVDSDVSSASGGAEGAASPITMGAVASGVEGPLFLKGRPAVPKLPLHKLQQEPAEPGGSRATGAEAQAPAPSKPLVPKLQLHKLQLPNGSGPATSQSSEDLIKAHPGGALPMDPIDNLDMALASARPPLSAKQSLSESFRKMVPMLSACRRGEVDWASQLSARGIGTPREDSGMMRTRPDDSLQKLSPDKQEEAAGTPSTAAPTGLTPRYAGANTPRGQLLRTLAAEAAVAQRQRSLRERTHQSTATYDDVLNMVDSALHSARGAAAGGSVAGLGAGVVTGGIATSPSKIPRPSGQPSARSLHPSPSKIPRFRSSPSKLSRAAGGDENATLRSGPPSPDKSQPADNQRGPLRASMENLLKFVM